jgi:hypothetical protein
MILPAAALACELQHCRLLVYCYLSLAAAVLLPHVLGLLPLLQLPMVLLLPPAAAAVLLLAPAGAHSVLPYPKLQQ